MQDIKTDPAASSLGRLRSALAMIEKATDDLPEHGSVKTDIMVAPLQAEASLEDLREFVWVPVPAGEKGEGNAHQRR